MSLWHEIKAMDALLERAAMREGSAASEHPVSTGLAASDEHTSYGVLVRTVPQTIRTVAAAHTCTWCKATPVGVLHMDSKDGVRR